MNKEIDTEKIRKLLEKAKNNLVRSRCSFASPNSITGKDYSPHNHWPETDCCCSGCTTKIAERDVDQALSLLKPCETCGGSRLIKPKGSPRSMQESLPYLEPCPDCEALHQNDTGQAPANRRHRHIIECCAICNHKTISDDVEHEDGGGQLYCLMDGCDIENWFLCDDFELDENIINKPIKPCQAFEGEVEEFVLLIEDEARSEYPNRDRVLDACKWLRRELEAQAKQIQQQYDKGWRDGSDAQDKADHEHIIKPLEAENRWIPTVNPPDNIDWDKKVLALEHESEIPKIMTMAEIFLDEGSEVEYWKPIILPKGE